VLLHAIATAVFGPALTAAVPAIVRKTQFTAANALLQSTTSLGIILGPALSGLGIAAYGSQEVLCLNAITYLVSALCLSLVCFTDSGTTVVSQTSRSTLMQDLIEGVRYSVVHRPVILLLTGTAALYTFGTAALTSLFPVFARKLLDLGPVEIGYLWSALGGGLLLTSVGLLWATGWTVRDRSKLIFSTSLLSGAAVCALVWTAHPYQAGILMGLIGGGMGAFTPIAWGIIQELTPGHLIGRVLGVYGAGAMTSAIAGISSFGWITERYGPGPGLLGIGIVMFATALFALRMSRTCTPILRETRS
jgi:MFS family permease